MPPRREKTMIDMSTEDLRQLYERVASAHPVDLGELFPDSLWTYGEGYEVTKEDFKALQRLSTVTIDFKWQFKRRGNWEKITGGTMLFPMAYDIIDDRYFIKYPGDRYLTLALFRRFVDNLETWDAIDNDSQRC